jgi:chaperonin GroES
LYYALFKAKGDQTMSALKIKPLGARIVIRRNEALATKGGILLPESSKEKPRQGTVMAVGPGKMDDHGKLQALPLKAGDQILFSSYAGSEYRKDEIDYLILAEEDVLAIVQEKE